MLAKMSVFTLFICFNLQIWICLCLGTNGYDVGNFTYDYRLVNGTTKYEGRFEIRRNNGPWGTVAGFWSTRHASVACRSLGFSSSVLSPDRSTIAFGKGTGLVHLLLNVCQGTESSVLDCDHKGWDSQGHWSTHCCDVGLYCLPGSETLVLRLSPISGTRNNTGLIQVFDGISKWGYICGIAWQYNTADIACRHLGFSSAIRAFTTKTRDEDHEFFMDTLKCTADTSRSLYTLCCDNCSSKGWDINRYCNSRTAAGISCFDGDLGDDIYELSLDGTNSNLAGVLHATFANELTWRIVCFSQQLIVDYKDALVVWVCSNLTGTTVHASARPADDCDLPMDHANTSRIAMMAHNRFYYDSDDKGRVVSVTPPGLQATEGTCSQFGYDALYVSCAKEMKHRGLSIPVTEDQSCVGRCGFKMEPVNCHCDPECESFNDCCIDYHDTCPNIIEVRSLNSTLFNCTIFQDGYIPELMSVYLVSKCPEDWTGLVVRKRCEVELDNDLTRRHFLTNWPVFDQYGNNFRNIYCAVCNGYYFLDVQQWDINIQSVTKSGHESCKGKSMDIVGERLRFCEPSLISQCPMPSNNSLIWSTCPTYSANVCPQATPGNFPNMFKNPHCAACNELHASPDILKPCSPEKDVLGSRPYLGYLWKFTTSYSQPPSISEPCSTDNQVFDPYSRLCHNVSCQRGIFSQNKVQCDDFPTPQHVFSTNGLCCQKQQSWIVFQTNSPTMPYNEDEIIACLLDLLNISKDGVDWETKRFIGLFHGFVLLMNNDSVCNLVPELNLLFTTQAVKLRWCGIHSIDYLYMCDEYPMIDKCVGPWFNGKTSSFILLNGTSPAAIFQHRDRFIIPQIVLNEVSYTLGEGQNGEDGLIKDEQVYVCGKETDILTCPTVTYIGEYEMSKSRENRTTLLIDNITIEQNDFLMFPNGQILICLERFLRHTEIETVFFLYSGSLDATNIIGTIVSLTSLTVLFVLHIVFSELRNFHGYCVMKLSITLFFAHLLPMTSSKVLFPNGLCIASAMIAHYAWLASFTWMVIIGANLLHLFISRPLETTEIRESSYVFQFLLPILGWCLPLSIVLVCVVLHFVKLEILFFEYGSSAPCWITDETANLVAFGVPVAFSLSINIVFFLMIAFLICRNQIHSRQLQHQERNHVQLGDVLICLKISFLLGIGWVFGFIAAAFDSQILWWTFVIINSLQGSFLLLSTVYSSHFKQILRERNPNRLKRQGRDLMKSPDGKASDNNADGTNEAGKRRRSILLKRFDTP